MEALKIIGAAIVGIAAFLVGAYFVYGAPHCNCSALPWL
jgi:hypothetical protein